MCRWLLLRVVCICLLPGWETTMHGNGKISWIANEKPFTKKVLSKNEGSLARFMSNGCQYYYLLSLSKLIQEKSEYYDLDTFQAHSRIGALKL